MNAGELAAILIAAATQEEPVLVADAYSEECWTNSHDECDTPTCACGCAH